MELSDDQKAVFLKYKQKRKIVFYDGTGWFRKKRID